jgi:RNA polymerase sigma-70 factor (ECF subfamily)
MRARWEGLHAALVRSVSTLHADRQFKEAKKAEAVLSRFESPVGLIEYLTDDSKDHEGKNAVYAALLRGVQQRTAWAELAMGVAWCGMWPALDRIYRRRYRLFKTEGGDRGADDLVSGISEAFTALVAGLDLHRVRWIAATLKRSTDRDLMEARRRDWAERDHVVANGDLESGAEDEPAAPALPDSELGLPPCLSLDEQVAALRDWLLDVAGEDGDLLLAVLVLEENQREAGERFGLSHEAARKRFRRALERVAKALSQSAPETRVSGSARAPKPEGAD